jgi:hypothetical protein
MSREPYTSAKRVFWIVDNGSSHRGNKAIKRLAKRFPNAVMVRTPVHASWLNQVEIVFSVVQRKVVSPNDFTDLDQIEQRLLAFEQRYNATARTFRWKFSPADLDDLLARLERRERHEQEQAPPRPECPGRTYGADHLGRAITAKPTLSTRGYRYTRRSSTVSRVATAPHFPPHMAPRRMCISPSSSAPTLSPLLTFTALSERATNRTRRQRKRTPRQVGRLVAS